MLVEPTNRTITSNNILQSGLGPLPDGWEESITNKGPTNIFLFIFLL